MTQNVISKKQSTIQKNGRKKLDCNSETKTKAILYQKFKKHLQPIKFTLHNTEIELQDHENFLGLIFDRNLTFKHRIQRIKEKIYKSLNLLKIMAQYDWCAEIQILTATYKAFIKSILNFGSITLQQKRTT